MPGPSSRGEEATLTTAFVLSIAVGLVRRGSLQRFVDLNLKALWLVAVAFGLQFAMRVGGYGGPVLAGAVYAGTYALLVAFVILNRSRWELLVMGIGLLSNALVIWVNGGKMPVSTAAFLAATGTTFSLDDPTHVPVTAVTRLHWLGDLWALRRPFPLPGVFSLGDVVVCIGLFLLVQHVMVPGRSSPSSVKATSV